MDNGKNKKVKELAENVSDSAKNLMNKAVGATKVSKATTAAIHHDVDELLDWIEQRNDAIQNETNGWNETRFENLPTLGKVIVGGEVGLQKLPEEKQKKYVEYFRKNINRIAVLTAVNPLFGIGLLGTEIASAGGISTKDSVGLTTVGAGLIGASTAASMFTPISYIAWSAMKTFVPALRLVGVGLFVFGAGATLFKSVENLPQGKKIIEIYNKTQTLCNECQDKLEKNTSEIGEALSQQIKSAIEKLEATSKKIAITIDDAIHSDQNLRLMQYQQIILDLYNNQNEIKSTLSELTEKYNTLQVENKLLAEKIVEYRDNMQTLAHSGEYLK